ncbi:MAG: suppressor of fused domain protein [Candidatus Dormibacteraeota bacterium]|nr:suppressor of fused domain protein [Candidatus Dormibacteraeota bacterium]
MSLVDHLERYLGEIEGGWSVDKDGHDMPFQVVRFPRGSGSGTVSFATLGLSRYPQPSYSGKEIRQELLMIVPDRLRDGPVPGLLQQIGMEVLAAARPLLRGEVIGPRGSLVAGSPMEAVYAAIPVYFPDDFAVYEGDDEPIVIAWLVPISAREASYVKQYGWEAFEQHLAETDPDLTDVFRPSLPVP